MNNDRHRLGEQGEIMAAHYLRAHGYSVVGTHFRSREGEIDLICHDGMTLVFVEVKTRRSHTFGGVFEAVNPLKLRRMKRVAGRYLDQYNWGGDFRIDVVGIQWPRGHSAPCVHHVKDVTL